MEIVRVVKVEMDMNGVMVMVMGFSLVVFSIDVLLVIVVMMV